MCDTPIPQIGDKETQRHAVRKKICTAAEKYMDDISNVTINNVNQLVKDVITSVNDAGKKKIRQKMNVKD